MFTFPATFFSSVQSSTTYIKSVQYISITIGTGSTSQSATITTVNASNTALILNGCSTTGTAIDLKTQIARVTLTNATTVTATRNTSSGSSVVTAYVCVIEFQSAAITSIQYGTQAWTSSDTSLTTTISSVTTSRSALFWLGWDTSGGGIANTNLWRGKIASATTLQWDKFTAGNSGTIAYCVVNFASGVTNSIQQISASSPLGTTSTDVTITSVNTGRVLSIWNGMTSNTGTLIWASVAHYGFLQSSTNFRFTRYGTVTIGRVLNATVIEFASGVVNSRQAAQVAITASNAAINSTITSVNKSLSITSMCGFANNATGAVNSSDVLPAVNLTSATNEQSLRSNGGTSESTTAWEVLQLN